MNERDLTRPNDGCLRSACHGLICVDEPIFLLTDSGRKEIGRISLCTHWTPRGICYKPQGEFRRLKGGIVLTASAWALMVRLHPHPPYYFVKDGDGIKPQCAGQIVPLEWGQDKAVVDES